MDHAGVDVREKCDGSENASCSKPRSTYRRRTVTFVARSRVDTAKRRQTERSIGSLFLKRAFSRTEIRRQSLSFRELPRSYGCTESSQQPRKTPGNTFGAWQPLAWHDGSWGVTFVKVNESMASNIFPLFTNVSQFSCPSLGIFIFFSTRQSIAWWARVLWKICAKGMWTLSVDAILLTCLSHSLHRKFYTRMSQVSHIFFHLFDQSCSRIFFLTLEYWRVGIDVISRETFTKTELSE